MATVQQFELSAIVEALIVLSAVWGGTCHPSRQVLKRIHKNRSRGLIVD